MRLLTTKDICGLTGLPASTLEDWVEGGVVDPVGKGKPGKGYHNKYGIMQAIALGVAAALRRQERGCPVPYVRKLVAAFGATNEDELREQFREGNTHFVTIHFGKPLLRGKQFDWVDVEEIYKVVIEKLENQETNAG